MTVGLFNAVVEQKEVMTQGLCTTNVQETNLILLAEIAIQVSWVFFIISNYLGG